MSKLYFTPTSCGAASYIAAKRAGVDFDEKYVINLGTHEVIKTGEDFYKINPKGNVPAIEFGNGSLLNESVGTLYWIGKNGNGVLGKNAQEEAEILNTLGYLASELHKAFGPMFYFKGEPAERKPLEDTITKKLEYLEKFYFSNGEKFLVGDDFSVADSYLYIILTWPGFLKFDISSFQKLTAYRDRIAELDFVKQAHEEMTKLQKEQEKN